MYKSSENYKRAVRPLLMEDRVLAVEQKFFCDRTTEKTITLTVTDNQNTPLTLTNTTQRLSCQYPLSAVKVNMKTISNPTPVKSVKGQSYLNFPGHFRAPAPKYLQQLVGVHQGGGD